MGASTSAAYQRKPGGLWWTCQLFGTLGAGVYLPFTTPVVNQPATGDDEAGTVQSPRRRRCGRSGSID